MIFGRVLVVETFDPGLGSHHDERRNDCPLRGLLEKSSDAELLREMMGFAAKCLMALEVGGLVAFGRLLPRRPG